MKFCIIDVSNLIHRAKHVIKEYDSPEECAGLMMNIAFNSIKRTVDRFHTDHCVACFDSYSWRTEIYPQYKANRKSKIKTPKEQEADQIIKQVLTDLREFLHNKTNVTVLHQPSIEADDFIGRWTQIHFSEEFSHVIVSGDSDFKQLVSKNVELFNPLSNILYNTDYILYQDNKKAGKDIPTIERYGTIWKVKMNKKLNEPEHFDPKWELFFKCIRGDINDNITSAYPNVRSTEMKKAFNDNGGLVWNNFINSMWGTDDNRQHVRDLYERNKQLIDLSRQPENIITLMDETIYNEISRDKRTMIGMHFQSFCTKFKLKELLNQKNFFITLLAHNYFD